MTLPLVQFVPLAFCLLLAGCSRHDATETAATEPAPLAPPPEAVPEPVPIVAQATPVPKRLAPEGVFFLLVKKSIETPDGIIGLAPGTPVRRQDDGKYAADGHAFEAQASEITNDLDLAARYAGADARAQAAIKQTLQTHATAARPGAPASAGTAAGVAPPAAGAADVPETSTPNTVVAPTQRSSGAGLESSSTLGNAHTKVKDGFLYERDTNGNWVKVRKL